MSSSKTLMIIDDSKVSRMMITAIIKDKKPDLNIIESSNGNEALDLSKGKSIDFFSIDYNMPGIDGLELISQLKKDFSSSKFALLTANIQDATHAKAKTIGATCINKPISEDSIIKMLGYFDGK